MSRWVDWLTQGKRFDASAIQSLENHGIHDVEQFSHSFPIGGASNQADATAAMRVAKLLGADPKPLGIGGAILTANVNDGTTGTGGWPHALRHLRRSRTAAPYEPGSQLIMFNYGLNDLAAIGVNNLAAFRECYRAVIARARSSSIKSQSDASVAYGGTTSLVNSPNSDDGQIRQIAVNGTATISVPADFPGGDIFIGHISVAGGGARYTYTVDGVAQTPLDLRTSGGLLAPSGIGYVTHHVKRLTGLSAGAHTIVVTVSNVDATYGYLDWWGIGSPNPPTIALIGQARVPSYSIWSGWWGTVNGGGGPSDTNVPVLNSFIDSIAAEWDSQVFTVPIDSYLNKQLKYWTGGGDNVHLGDEGHARLAHAMAQGIREKADPEKLAHGDLTPDYKWHFVGDNQQPQFQNSWTHYGVLVEQFARVSFRKDRSGMVHLRGVAKNGANGTIMFQLPAGFRPHERVLAVTVISGGGSLSALGRIDVDTNGNVYGQLSSNAFTVLENISFPAAA